MKKHYFDIDKIFISPVAAVNINIAGTILIGIITGILYNIIRKEQG